MYLTLILTAVQIVLMGLEDTLVAPPGKMRADSPAWIQSGERAGE
jgi:hypothetical protein